MSKKPVVSAKTEGMTRRKIASKVIGTLRTAPIVPIDVLHEIGQNVQMNAIGIFQNAICTYRDSFLFTEKKHITFDRVGSEEFLSKNGNEAWRPIKGKDGKTAYKLVERYTAPRDNKTGEPSSPILDCAIMVNIAPTFGGLPGGALSVFTLGRDISTRSGGMFGKAQTIMTIDLDPAVFVGHQVNIVLYTIFLMADRFAESNLLLPKKVTRTYSQMMTRDPLFNALDNAGRIKSVLEMRQSYRNQQESLEDTVDLVAEDVYVPAVDFGKKTKGLIPDRHKKYLFSVAGSIEDVHARKLTSATKRAEEQRKKVLRYQMAGVPPTPFSIRRDVDKDGNLKPFDATQFVTMLAYFPETNNLVKLVAAAMNALEERNPEAAYRLVRTAASRILEDVKPEPDLYAEPNGEHTPAGKPRTVGKNSKNGSRSTRTRRKAQPVEVEAEADA